MTAKKSNDELDALLAAIARAGAEPAAAEEGVTSTADDEALIARITAGVLAQQSAPMMPRSSAAPRRLRPWWLGVATAASLALAWLLVPRPYDAAVLPGYAFEISGLDAGQRDHAVANAMRRVGAITLGNRLVVTLRPETATGVITAARLWHARGNAIEMLDVPLQRSAAGTVRLDVEVGSELQLAPGDHQLWLVIGPDDYQPDAATLHAVVQPTAAHGQYMLPFSLAVRAATP
jgi:hypothetical protein